jgi:predicted DNA-binding transcriptional regulator AlpA
MAFSLLDMDKKMSLSSASSRIVRMPEIVRRVGVSQQTVYRWQKARKFPPMVRLGDYSVGVDGEALDKWIGSRLAIANVAASD